MNKEGLKILVGDVVVSLNELIRLIVKEQDAGSFGTENQREARWQLTERLTSLLLSLDRESKKEVKNGL